MHLGLIGVWSGALRRAERSTILDAAAELEDLGFGTISWPTGMPKQSCQRVSEHLAAGADHVCIQVLTETPSRIPMHGFRQLARVLPH